MQKLVIPLELQATEPSNSGAWFCATKRASPNRQCEANRGIANLRFGDATFVSPEFLIEVLLKVQVSWNVTPCRLVNTDVSKSLHSFETSINIYLSAGRKIPADFNVQSKM
jgi:hypothetical protein